VARRADEAVPCVSAAEQARSRAWLRNRARWKFSQAEWADLLSTYRRALRDEKFAASLRDSLRAIVAEVTFRDGEIGYRAAGGDPVTIRFEELSASAKDITIRVQRKSGAFPVKIHFLDGDTLEMMWIDGSGDGGRMHRFLRTH
jgi:hypothetical protein